MPPTKVKNKIQKTRSSLVRTTSPQVEPRAQRFRFDKKPDWSFQGPCQSTGIILIGGRYVCHDKWVGQFTIVAGGSQVCRKVSSWRGMTGGVTHQVSDWSKEGIAE